MHKSDKFFFTFSEFSLFQNRLIDGFFSIIYHAAC